MNNHKEKVVVKSDKELVRFGVAMPSDLLAQFDELITAKHYKNRSEAIRDLVRDALVEEEWKNDDRIVAGVITLVYAHDRFESADRLIEVQHDHHELVLATLHVHLNHDDCLEAIIVKGKRSEVTKLANSLIASRGVKHGKLNEATFGQGFL